MAKFYGAIGYVEIVESYPGVWNEQIIEKMYKGDVLKNTHKWDKGEGLNDNLNVNHSISIVSDDYICQNLFAIKYVTWMGTRWKVLSAEIQRPRVILSIGGVYNGPSI